MPIQTTNQGNVLLSWEAQEFEQHQRGPWWYFGATAIGGGLVLVALFSDNYLLALIILLISVLSMVYERQGPRTLTVRLLDTGVALGETVIPYSDVDHFFFAERGDRGESLYILFRSIRRPRWSIEVGAIGTEAIRKVLRRYAREEQEDAHEPLSDVVSRVLKL